MLSRIVIDADGPTMLDATITVDGHALVGLTGLTLRMAPGDITEVGLTLLVDRVEATAEALAMIEAHVQPAEAPLFEGHACDAERWLEDADEMPARIRITEARP